MHPWARIVETCPRCGHLYEREEGYWLGAVLLNTIAAVILFAALFILLTVLGEYLARLLVETRDRPLYFLQTELTSNVLVPNEDRRNVVLESRRPARFRATTCSSSPTKRTGSAWLCR